MNRRAAKSRLRDFTALLSRHPSYTTDTARRHLVLFLFTIADAAEEAVRAQNDPEFMNRFIERNRRFVMFCAFRTLKHFISESDDEWSVALIAFHEAVLAYGREKGNFKQFAALIIRRRLIDHLNAERRHAAEIPADTFSADISEDEDDVSPLQLELRKKEAELSENDSAHTGGVPGSTPVRDEIEAVQQLLKHYGFSFFDLTECSPKAEKTKTACAALVKLLVTDEMLFLKMRDAKSLPVKDLCERSGVPRKIAERHRKYIIAAAEIMRGEYPLLQDYMDYIRKTLDTGGGRQ